METRTERRKTRKYLDQSKSSIREIRETWDVLVGEGGGWTVEGGEERVLEPGEHAAVIAKCLEGKRRVIYRRGVRRVPACAEGKINREGGGARRIARKQAPVNKSEPWDLETASRDKRKRARYSPGIVMREDGRGIPGRG